MKPRFKNIVNKNTAMRLTIMQVHHLNERAFLVKRITQIDEFAGKGKIVPVF